MENEDDIEQINAKTENLAAASMKIGEAMYGSAAEAESSTPGSGQKEATDSSADAKVVDGEYKT